MYPQFRLTKLESKYSTKYDNPDIKQVPVINRIYAGHLTLTESDRAPSYYLNIARRTRVVALTASGNISFFRVEIKNVTGEQYTSGRVPFTHLVGGPMLSALGTDNYTGGRIDNQLKHTTYPYIFEPNIVLAPNQTLVVYGYPMVPYVSPYDNEYRIDFCFHVVEFPGDPGSPQ